MISIVSHSPEGKPAIPRKKKTVKRDIDMYKENHLGPEIGKEWKGTFLVDKLVNLSVLESELNFCL